MKKINKLSIYILLALAFMVFFYVATSLYPMCQDDYFYKYVFDTPELVNSLSDVFRSQKNHWFLLNGRFVAHCLVQAFLMFERLWFCLANCACYVLCCGCIARLVSRHNLVRNFVLVLLSLWLVMPTPGSTFFWLTGSFNYLWAMCATSVFLCLLLSDNKTLKVIAIPVGIIAGNWHEAMALATVFSLILYCILSPKKGRLFYVAVLAYFCGALTNIVAPGNFVRLETVYTPTLSNNGMLDFVLRYVRNFMKLGYRLTLNWSDIGIQVIACAWCVSICWCYKAFKNKCKNNCYILPLCLLMGALCSTSLNVVSGVAYPRTLLGFCFITYLAFVLIFFNVKSGTFSRAFLAVFMVADLVFMPLACYRINVYRITMQNLEKNCSEGIYITRAHPEQEKSEKSRLSCGIIYPCTLETGFMKGYLRIKEISILRDSEFEIITKYMPKLRQMPFHDQMLLEKSLYVTRLEGRPKKMKASITHNPDALSKKSLLQRVSIWVDSQRTPEKQCFVICVDDEYYAYWYKTEEMDALIEACYPNGRQVIIGES